MSAGDFKGSLAGSATSIGTSIAASTAVGDLNVRVGDLIVCLVCEQTTLRASNSVTDNLHTPTTYTAQNAGTDAGTSTGQAFYKVATAAGLLTSVTATISPTGGTDNGVIVAALYQGPFTATPLDKSPANQTSDVTSQFDGPATGTLTQATELVVSWTVSTGNTAWTAVAPLIKDVEQATATILAGRLGHQVVNATTTVVSSWTAGANPTDDIMGTMSFLIDTTAAAGESVTDRPIGTKEITRHPISLRSWTQSPRPTEPTVTTYMPSVVTEWPVSPGPKFPPGVWLQGFNPNLQPVVPAAAPFSQTDWPNSTRGASYPGQLRSWLQSSIQTVVTPQAPFSQADWPNPRGVAYPVALQSWLQASIQTVAPVAIPFSQNDWPVVQGAAYPTSLRTWIDQTKSQLIGQDTLPIRQQDWPVPSGPLYPIDARTWLQGFSAALATAPIVAYMPSVVTEWPNPLVAAPLVQSFTSAFNPNLTPAAPVVPLPFNQQDWPLPRGPIFDLDQHGWIQSPVPATYIFRQPIVHRVRGPEYAVDLHTWIQGHNPNLLTGKDTLPFRQMDWPLPRGQHPATALRSWTWSYPLTLVGKDKLPFRQTDWPNSRAALFWTDLRTWTQGFNPNLPPTPPTPSASFSQTEWPLSQGSVHPTYPIDLRTFLPAFNINLPPTPPEPPEPPAPEAAAPFILPIRDHYRKLRRFFYPREYEEECRRAREALEEARERLAEEKASKAKSALRRATKLAAAAIEAAKPECDDLERLTRLLEGAANAEKTAGVIVNANAAARAAKAILQEADDEEALLLI